MDLLSSMSRSYLGWTIPAMMVHLIYGLWEDGRRAIAGSWCDRGAVVARLVGRPWSGRGKFRGRRGAVAGCSWGGRGEIRGGRGAFAGQSWGGHSFYFSGTLHPAPPGQKWSSRLWNLPLIIRQ